ncbi:MAG: acyltransferase [Lachnospiraceae bacterium]|nr:acyltransferase [Lachnospiraceae bacterium]
MNENTKNSRIYSLDVVRILSTLGIILFHWFTLAADGRYAGVPNGPSWGTNAGGALSTVFFILSGFLLYSRWTGIGKYSLNKYFKTRFLAIFPMYYIAFIIATLPRILVGRGAAAPKWTLIFTVFGLDGWLSELFPTFAVVGEWFIGAIVILYLIFPLIDRLYRWNIDMVMAVMTILMIIFRNEHLINPNSFHSILSCLFSFTFGAWLAAHDLHKSRTAGIISLIGYVILTVIRVPSSWNMNLYYHICGMLLFPALNLIGMLLASSLEKSSGFQNVIIKMSGLSYPVFLIHHAVILAIIQFLTPQTFPSVIGCLAIVLIGTVILALIIQKISMLICRLFSRQRS